MAIHPGDILAGYRVTRLLGRGGMGEVWAAVSEPDEHGRRQEVAIKVLLARAAMKPDLVRRFEREAKIASAIKSPYVCQLLEVAEADDGAHLLVFEHLSGESLADRLKREQYLPFSEVGPILDDVLQGLAAAHEAGVIHRDLKPGNIFLEQRPIEEPVATGGFEGSPIATAEGFGESPIATAGAGGFGGSPSIVTDIAAEPPLFRRERAKILDFGISKLTRHDGEREPTLTAFDATLGSFAYMAPEQVRGAARADERADIYAVGAVAFRSLSGRLPFEGTTAAVLVAMKLDRAAPSLAEITGDQWPAGVERFLERALERKRENRFASAAEALDAWRMTTLGPAASTRSVPSPAPSRPLPIAKPSRPGSVIPPPSKPVVEVYQKATIPEVEPNNTPPARPPMPSYEVVEDHPTEVDGPPEMTYDGSYSPEPVTMGGDPPYPPAQPVDGGTRHKTGRP